MFILEQIGLIKKEVEVTIVSDKNENYGGANIKSFPDLVYVGELKGHVRPIFH